MHQIAERSADPALLEFLTAIGQSAAPSLSALLGRLEQRIRKSERLSDLVDLIKEGDISSPASALGRASSTPFDEDTGG
jgi:hypothetical protein